MRILLLAPHPFFQERGTPIAVRLLAGELVAMGHEVEMLCYHEGEAVDMPGVRVHRISPPGWVKNVPPGPSWQKAVCDAYMLPHALRLARGGGFDLVHAVEEAAGMAWVIKRRLKIPYVYDMDSCISQQIADKYPAAGPAAGLVSRLEGGWVKGSLGVVAVCQALVEVSQVHDRAVPVCRLEDISLLEQPEDPPDERLDYGGPVAMYVGNLESYQGIDLLLDAFALAHDQRPDAHLAVIGGSQADVAAYRDKARSMGLSGAAHFLGPRPQAHLAHYLEQAEVLVSPRIQGQNTPMKIYSYLDSGRPVLATRLSTHTQVLDDDISVLVEPQAEHMAMGLITLLDDEALREDMAQRARERVAAEYSRQAYRRKLRDFYQGVERACRIGSQT